METLEDQAVRKSYEQICPMATALDFVGDRWTILILRELLGGSARFQELRDGLPGIATNLLTERLRRMESDGIVRRIEAGGSSLYALTDAGERIRTAIEELGMWGARMARISEPIHQRSIRAIAMALQSILVRAGERLPDAAEVLELDVDGEFLEITLGPNPTVVARLALHPAVLLAITTSEISDYLLGGEVGRDAFRLVAGDESAKTRLLIALGAVA